MKSIVIQSPQEDELYGFKVHNFLLYVGESTNEMKVLAAIQVPFFNLYFMSVC